MLWVMEEKLIGKDRVKYIIYMILLRPLSWLPLGVLYVLSDVLRVVLERMLHYRREVIRLNLHTSFPEKSEEEIKKIEHGFYCQLADNIVETVKLLHISDKTIDKRVKVKGADLVERIADAGAPVFLYLGHYGNWEWVPAISRHYNRPQKSAQIYKPLHDRAFDAVMQRIRSRFGSYNIPQNQALRTLFKFRKDYGSYIVGIIDDHSPNHDRSKHFMTFLDHDRTLINVGGEEIGRRLGARYLYLDVEKPRRGYYTLTFMEMKVNEADADYPFSREYMRMLETTIRRDPSLWLWSHKRWRYNGLYRKNKQK